MADPTNTTEAEAPIEAPIEAHEPMPPFDPDAKCPKCWTPGPHDVAYSGDEETEEWFKRGCVRCGYSWEEAVPNGPPRAVHTIEHWNITAGMIGNDGVPRRIVMQHADDSERSTTLVSTAAAQRLAEVAGKLYEALLPFSYLEPPTGSGNDAYRLNAADLERAVDATEAFEAIMGGGGG